MKPDQNPNDARARMVAEFDDALREVYDLNERKDPPVWLLVLLVVLGGPCVYFMATHPPDPPPPCRGQRVHLTDGVRHFEGCIEPPRRTP